MPASTAEPKFYTSGLIRLTRPQMFWTMTGLLLAVLLAAVVRIGAALIPTWLIPLLAVSGILWAAAFLGFGMAYGRVLAVTAQSK